MSIRSKKEFTIHEPSCAMCHRAISFKDSRLFMGMCRKCYSKGSREGSALPYLIAIVVYLGLVLFIALPALKKWLEAALPL